MIIKGQKRVWQDAPVSFKGFSYKGSEFIVDEPGEWTTLWHLEGEEPGSRSALTDFMAESSRKVMDPPDLPSMEDLAEDLKNLNSVVQERLWYSLEGRFMEEEFHPSFRVALAEFLDKWYGPIVDGDV